MEMAMGIQRNWKEVLKKNKQKTPVSKQEGSKVISKFRDCETERMVVIFIKIMMLEIQTTLTEINEIDN